MFSISRTLGSRIAIKVIARKQNWFEPGMTRVASLTQTAFTRNSSYNYVKGKKPVIHNVGTVLVLGSLGYAGYKILTEENAYCTPKKVDKKHNQCEDKCGDSDFLHKLDTEEEMMAKANHDFVCALRKAKLKAMDTSEAAIKAFCEATDAITQFMNKAYWAIEQEGKTVSPEFEDIWCEVYDFATQKCEKVADAINKNKCAWEALCPLREVINNGKNCKYTCCHPLIVPAEESLLCAERELLNARAKMNCVHPDSQLFEQYAKLVQEFRHDLQSELKTLRERRPEDECSGDNECASILPLAYKKVLQAQKELALLLVSTGKVPEKQIETLC